MTENENIRINMLTKENVQELRRKRFAEKYKTAFGTDLDVNEKQHNVPKKVVVNIYGIKSSWM